MVIEVVVDAPEVEANTPPAEVEERAIVSAVVVALLKMSCSATVIGPRVALEDAAPDTAVVVRTSLATPAGVMVSVWPPEVSPPEALMVGVPDLVSP